MTKVVVYDNFEKSFRKFKKKIQNSGLLEEVRRRQHYEKPTAVRKRKLASAKARHRKKVRLAERPVRKY